MNKQRTQNQQSSALFCAEHNEPVKGICFSQHQCRKRLLCRTCRKVHDSNHLNFYDSLEDVTQAVIVNDIIKEFNNMIRRIDTHHQASSVNTQTLLGKIDVMFNAIQNHVMHQLTQSKAVITEEITRRFKIDNTNKQKLVSSMEELHKAFKTAENNQFQTFPALDDLIQAIIQAQGLRDYLAKDPSMNIQQTAELLALYLEDVATGRSLQIMTDNFDKILQDLTNNFVSRGNRGPPRLFPINQPDGTNRLEQMAQEYSMMANQNEGSGTMNVESAQPQPNLFPQQMNFPFLHSNKPTPNQIPINPNAFAELLSPFKQFQTSINLLNQLQNQNQNQNQPPAQHQPTNLGIDLQALGQNFNLSSFLGNMGAGNATNQQQQQPQEEPARDQMTVDNQGPEAGQSPPVLENSPAFGADYTELNPEEPNNGLYQPFFKPSTTRKDGYEMSDSYPDQSQNNFEEGPFGSGFRQTQMTFQPHTQSARASVTKSDGMIYQPRGLEEEGANYWEERPSYSGSMHVESEFRPKVSMNKHTPSNLLDIFQKVNEDMQLNQPLMTLNQDKKATPTGAYNPNTAGKSTQGKAKKDLELLRHEVDLNTGHPSISTGGFLYISQRNHLVTSGADGKIHVWDLLKQESINVFEAHNGDIFKLLYIEEQDVLVSSGLDLIINVWDCKNNYQHLLKFDKHQEIVYALEYLPDLDVIASGGEDCQVRFWTIEDGKETQTVQLNAKIGSICYMASAKKLAVGCDGGQIHILDVSSEGMKIVHSTQAHNGSIFNMACVEENGWLITSSTSDDGLIKIWKLDANRCDCIREFGEKSKVVRSFGLVPERDLIISNHDDSYLRVWKLSTGEDVMKQFEESLGESTCVLKNQNKVATVSKSKVRIWKINN